MGEISDSIINKMENQEIKILNLETGEIIECHGTDYMYNKEYWNKNKYKIFED